LPFTTAELAAAGIGAHHAGLELSDKRLVEELFLNRILRVVVATSVGWSLVVVGAAFLISFRRLHLV